MQGVPELNPVSDPVLADQLRTAEQPYLTRLEEIKDTLPLDVVERIYGLGVAAGVAMMKAQIAYESGVAPDDEVVESMHSEHKWKRTEDLKLINDTPVTSVQNMVEFERDVLGKPLQTATIGVRLFNALTRDQISPSEDLGVANMVRQIMRFYDVKELPWQPAVTSPKYIDLLSMLDATKALLSEWRGRSDFKTGIYRLNIGSIRYMAAFLNHSLQLDPPLESY